MRVVCDTAPLVAAVNRDDRAHHLAAALVTELGRDLLIPSPVLVETDQLLRARIGTLAAQVFLESVVQGEHRVVFLTLALLRRAAEIDRQFSQLDLGLADAAVMAVAEANRLPILTFDFRDFRAAVPNGGYWELVVDEDRYASETQPRSN